MVQLQRIGKDKVINHHYDVPYKVLNKSYTFGDENSGNKIIHGDNLEALKALLPQYEGEIDVIYIDPPYNTGNEKWKYNDNVNDPKIKKRLNETVGTEDTDLSRHDKWLCMMYPRLKLLGQLLSEDGVIFISIDDKESCYLKVLCDEIFGRKNYHGMLSWIKKTKPVNMGSAQYSLQSNVEYVHVYGKKPQDEHNYFLPEVAQKEYPFFDEEKNDYYREESVDQRKNIGSMRRDRMVYEVLGISPKQGFRWQLSPDKRDELLSQNRLFVKRNKLYIKYYKSDEEVSGQLEPFWTFRKDIPTAEEAKEDLERMFGVDDIFDTVKPKELIMDAVLFSSKKDSIILDSFAGSGPTADAVLNLNKQDGGNRKFILVELMDYAEEITAERVKKVINGYSYDTKVKNETVRVDIEGTGGGFDFYELGEPLFIDGEYLNEEIGVDVLRNYIRYTETKSEIQNVEKNNEYYLGTQFNTDYYFYYERDAVTILDTDFLATIMEKNEQMIIYADKCHLSKKFLGNNGIIFKKIPRDIKRF